MVAALCVCVTHWLRCASCPCCRPEAARVCAPQGGAERAAAAGARALGQALGAGRRRHAAGRPQGCGGCLPAAGRRAGSAPEHHGGGGAPIAACPPACRPHAAACWTVSACRGGGSGLLPPRAVWHVRSCFSVLPNEQAAFWVCMLVIECAGGHHADGGHGRRVCGGAEAGGPGASVWVSAGGAGEGRGHPRSAGPIQGCVFQPCPARAAPCSFTGIHRSSSRRVGALPPPLCDPLHF